MADFFIMPEDQKVDIYFFTVEGAGEFPSDMLRYDWAFPVTLEALDNMQLGPLGKRRSVKLGCVKRGGPTIDRWRSFGWTVVNPELDDE